MDIGQGSSWIPATPGKPGFAKSAPICSNEQENQQAQVDWSDLQRKQALEHATGSTAKAQNAAAYRGSVTVDRCFISSEAAVGTKSKMYGGGINMYNNFPSDNVDMWSNVSFGDLLAMAHAGGSGTTPADETAYSVKSSFQPLINTQNAGRQMKYSLIHSFLLIVMTLLLGGSSHYDNCIPCVCQGLLLPTSLTKQCLCALQDLQNV